ncbi:MAG TPA: ATP-binding protein [Ktedonobacterales bacterium]
MFEAETHGQSGLPYEFRIGHRTRERATEPQQLVSELHDTVIQPLSSLLVSMSRLECQPSSGEHLQSNLGMWKGLAQEALDALRSSLAGLQASVLSIRDLPQGLQCTLLPQFSMQGLQVNLESHDWPGDLPPEWNSSLYLMVREALTNVIKHAHATEVSVLLFADSAGVAVTVKDNGMGFPLVDCPSERYVQPGCGLGINSMRERVALLGGKLALSTAPGRGVQIDIQLPRPRPMDRPKNSQSLAYSDNERTPGRYVQ